jgi:hypothetical protein
LNEGDGVFFFAFDVFWTGFRVEACCCGGARRKDKEKGEREKVYFN